MWLSRPAADIGGMSPTQHVPTSLSSRSVRACRGEDAADLQRRLEAFLLIARRVGSTPVASAR